jgi:hypothetical protein
VADVITSAPEPVLLILADISGYTRYMTANAKTLAHSQTVITALVTALVRQVELPLEIAKLEGDAIFLFCRKARGAVPWSEARRLVGGKLLAFFRVFRETLSELATSTTCTCNACAHIDRLRLKIVVHSGEALFHRVLQFSELAGVDVIVAHRLLKNSIAADQYLLVTVPAMDDLDFPQEVHWVEGSEAYNELGRIGTLVYLPEREGSGPVTAHSKTFLQRFGNCADLYSKLWFSPVVAVSSARSRPYRNLATEVGRPRRLAFATVTLLLTPLFLPVSMLMAGIHALRTGRPRHRPIEVDHGNRG